MRRRALVLLTVASIVSSLQTANSAFVFSAYTNWARQCLGGPSDGVCGPSAAQFLDFTYAQLTGGPVTVSTEQLTSACQQCAPALDQALSTVVPNGGDPAACPFLPDKDSLSLASIALRHYVCWGAPSGAADGSGSSSNSSSSSASSGAGACVTMMASALEGADLLGRVSAFDPTLRFTGPVLQRLCPQLAPPAAGGAGGSCCSRSWAYLMAALASQACLPDLSREYLALPGRCEALLGLSLPGFCEAGWPSALMPLLTAPPASRCSGANQPINWLQGTACSTDQLRMARCPRSTCDLWCGAVGAAAAADQPAPPSPPSSLNTESGGGATGGTDSGGGGSGDSGGGGLTVATVVIICVFSVLILALLVALAMWAFAVRRERKAAEREGFAFDQDLHDAPTVPNSPGAPPPGKLLDEPAAPGGAAAAMAATPGGAGGAGGFAAAITAAAAGVGAAGASTPRYIPGGGAAGGSEAAAGPSASGDAAGSSVARTLVFDGAAGAGPSRAAGAAAAAGGAAAGGAAAAASMASSKYGSAQSLLKAPPSAVGGASTHGTSTGVFMTPATSEKSLAQLDRLRSHRVSNPGSEAGTQYESMPLPDNMSSVEGSISNLPPGAYIGSHAILSRDSTGSYVTARSAAVSGTSLMSGAGGGGGLGSGAGSVLLGPGAPGTSPPLPRSQGVSGTASPLPGARVSLAPGAAAAGPAAAGAGGAAAAGGAGSINGGAAGGSGEAAAAAGGGAGAPAAPPHARRASDVPVLETVREH
ncbi:hypothetical protein HYH02_007460 [Chlamydomonas schloesseri]|uniref:SPARK domain-containing protein n=1 Tax=Chlamydomonas schloesseri TaxID=2026947 RepID=A0A835WHJ1_9CHLO|nr:hypothetical protein HYH02_007460 [Chlamydomonas schloesseri]|eukprot:KAG2447536.1 hypothetical protein HYH02_007460 [Chlamydomonas schloesseri]